jgi:hypothetical protein
MKAEGREGKEGSKNAQSKDSMSKEGMSKDSAQSKEGMSKDKNGMSKDSAQSKEGRPSGTNAAQDTKSGAGSSTTGNAATSATAAPPPEKRTQIVSAIKSERIEDVGSNVNVNVSIGSRLPDTVRFHPLPPRIVEIYPEWRDYQVVRIHGRYVIVRPETREIVYVIEG